MKKTVVIFVIAFLVIITSGLWIFSGQKSANPTELVSLGVVVLMVGFALFLGYRRLTAVKKGQPAEDEMSKKVMLKTSSLSYYISLYLWLVIMYFSDRVNYETHTIIGAGLLGMAVVFGISWLIFNFLGVGNE